MNHEHLDCARSVQRAKDDARLAGAAPTDALARYVRHDGIMLPHVAAVVGGMLSQEVLKAITRKGAPIDNVFIYESESGNGSLVTAPAREVQPAVAKPPRAASDVLECDGDGGEEDDGILVLS